MAKFKLAALTLGASILLALTIGVAYAYDGESSAEAKQSFCESLSDLSSTVMSYEGLNPETATIDELDSAEADITNAWDDVEDEWYDWAYAEDNALMEAYDDLYYAIQDLPGDYTVAQSLDSLEDELSAFPQAFSETFDGSGCTNTA